VVLPFTSASVVYLPDFRVRCDFVPGPTTRLRLVPNKTGRYLFHCNIYGGVGHEDVDGTIHVVA
jgi:cytochrome c oxidase subunit 2